MSQPSNWSDISSYIVDFSQIHEPRFSGIFRQRQTAIAITGPAGTGKSTFFLWAIARALDEGDAWFDHVVFLSPAILKSNNEDWKHHLLELKSDRTLIAADGLFRVGDDEVQRRRKVEAVKGLLSPQSIANRRLGPFAVALTLRAEEYPELLRLGWNGVEEFPLRPDSLPLSEVLGARLRAWGVPYDPVELGRLGDAIRTKSGGLPVYLELLASELAVKKQRFDYKMLEAFPSGMVNLVWQILHKNCSPLNGHEPALSIVKLLSTGVRVSDYFLEEVLQTLCVGRYLGQARSQCESVCSYHEVVPSPVHGVRYFTLDSHWRAALEEGVNNRDAVQYTDTLLRYMAVDVDQATVEICKALRAKLTGTSFRHALLAADLIRLGAIPEAEAATHAWVSAKSRVLAGNRSAWEQAEIVLYNDWLERARQAPNSAQAQPAFKVAFAISAEFASERRLHLEKDQLHSYLKYLRSTVLVECSESDYDKQFADVESLYDRLIALAPEDPGVWESRANFYREELHFEKAVTCCEQAVKLRSSDPIENLDALTTYGRCLGMWAEFEWTTDPDHASVLFQEAKKKNDDALDYVREVEQDGDATKLHDPEDWKWTKQRLRQEYAARCFQESTHESGSQAHALRERAHALLEQNLKEDRDNPYTIARYVDSLLGRGAARSEQGRSEITELLANPIRSARTRSEDPDPQLLRSFAKFLLRCNPPDFKQAEANLLAAEKTSGTFWERTLAWQDLGRLYLRWGDAEPQHVRDHIVKALKLLPTEETHKTGVASSDADIRTVPANRKTAGLLVKLHVLRARCYDAIEDREGYKREWERTKAIFLDKHSVLKPLTVVVIQFGNDLLEDEQWQAAEEAFKLAAGLQGSGWYPHRILGDLCMRRKEFDPAIEHYKTAARLSRGPKGPAAIRNLVRDVEESEGRITGRLQPARRRMYQELRLSLSKRAYQLASSEVKNITDYAEDLKDSNQYKEAIDRFREAHNLLRKIRNPKLRTAGANIPIRQEVPEDALARIWWNTGEANYELYREQNDSRRLRIAQRLMRGLAKLVNVESRWERLASYENKWGDSAGFLAAYEQWLASVERLSERERTVIPIHQVHAHLKSAFFHYKECKNIKGAAISNRWRAALGHVSFISGRDKKDPEDVYGATGAWLLKNDYPELALECSLNAMRLFNRPPSTKSVSDPAESFVNRALDRLHSRQRVVDLQAAVAACGRKELADRLKVVLPYDRVAARKKSVATLTDEIDRLIWLEATDDIGTAQGLCGDIADRFLADNRVALSPHSIRLVADGLLVERDLDRARMLYQRLASCTGWPERFFASCAARAIPRPEHAAAAAVS